MPLWSADVVHLAGIDEAGRGSWAGPVTAGAVVLPVDENLLTRLPGVRDSKRMTSRQRAIWSIEIKSVSLAWGIGFASSEEIDAIGIVPATRIAMKRALENLGITPQHLLIDALFLRELMVPQTALIKGDGRSLSIAAASVLAKTSRDAFMVDLDGQYPGYEFWRHKGYGTRIHREALLSLGPCLVHRWTYKPIKALSGPPVRKNGFSHFSSN